MKDAVIFFLADKGVSQVSVWEEWRNLSTSTNIHFRVLTTEQKAQQQVRHHLLRKQNNQVVYIGQTKWARFSIVYETIVGYFYIAQEAVKKGWADDTIVMLVSGTDIPIRHPDKVFTIISHDLVCYTTRKSDLYYHSQFMGLTLRSIKHKLLEHIGLDVVQPFDRKKVYQWWEPTLRKVSRYSDIIPLVPDMIFLNGVFPRAEDIGNRACISMSFTSSPSLNSPITWDNDDEKIVWFNEFKNYPGFYLYIAFKDMLHIIQYMKTKRPYMFFFRKVSPSLHLPRMIDIWNDNPPPISFNKILKDHTHFLTSQQEQTISTRVQKQRSNLRQAAQQQVSSLQQR